MNKNKLPAAAETVAAKPELQPVSFPVLTRAEYIMHWQVEHAEEPENRQKIRRAQRAWQRYQRELPN